MRITYKRRAQRGGCVEHRIGALPPPIKCFDEVCIGNLPPDERYRASSIVGNARWYTGNSVS